VYYDTHGTVDVLQVGELPVPAPGPDEVLVQIAAAGVNPIDRRLRAGELTEYITRTFPVVPGWDLAGRIVAVGEKVSGWNIGDDVLGLAFTWSIQHGTYAEFAPVNAGSIALKPASLSFVQAAAIPLVSLTAWQSLAEFAQLKPGQTVLIEAGAGGVGSVAISIAKHLGATVYTTASARNADYVYGLGADHVIDYTKENYADVIRSREPAGIDAVLVAILDDDNIAAALELVKPGGAVAYMNNEPPQTNLIAEKNIKTEFIHHRPDGASLAELVGLFAEGKLQLPEISTMPLEQAMDAQRQSEGGRTRGKLVLEIQSLR
ncbi:MAG: NADP-dependent oxidoreductase, partial [Gammaproteobacteria bacterium]